MPNLQKSYAFGMEMPGRSIGSDFAYNFNGKRTDKWNGDNGSYLDFGARIHDARLGRFFTTDPDAARYANYSPYLYAGNKPINFIDFEGKGPKYKNCADVFEKRLKQLQDDYKVLSFKKYDYSDAGGNVLFTVKKVINGQVVEALYDFNEKDNDSDYETLLIDYGVNMPEAVCAASNSKSKSAYWTMKAKDDYYSKFENGGPLLLKTWATLATLGHAASIGLAELGIETIIVDGVVLLDDVSSVFSVSNMTFLERLAEKAGLDSKRIQNAKDAIDVLNGLKDIKDVIGEVKDRMSTFGLSQNEAVHITKILDFMSGQIDMDRQYYGLIEKQMKKNVDKAKTGRKIDKKAKKDKHTPSF